MLTPEITLKIIRRGWYGAKAMERRVKTCCADNPECPYQLECAKEYDRFVDGTITRKDIYHQLRMLGVGSVDARNNLSISRVKELASAAP